VPDLNGTTATCPICGNRRPASRAGSTARPH
jgi:hypothetical protein